jgi:hypothetical protein
MSKAKLRAKGLLLTLALSLAGCPFTQGESKLHCQGECKPDFFVGFDHHGRCRCSPVEIECKAKAGK